ncbi:MAG: hypothetical protein JWM89_2148 [Acidimicrobiales bacterium]|nr:hypothetical protein [Acidimicrobiales bacterium]
MPLVVEFTVEPFVEGTPGPHVEAAIDAAKGDGLRVDFGPFGTSVSGDDPDLVLAATDRAVRAALAAGASRVSVLVSQDDAPPL